MPNIRTSTSRGPCDCPVDAYTLGSSVVAVDIIDGNPAEYNEFVANIDDFGIDRDDTSDSADLREILGLPDPEVDSEGNITLRYKWGSGIKVESGDRDYDIWKPHRYDCGCGHYDCDGGSTDIEPIPCFLDRFVDDNGVLDISCDQATVIPVMLLQETYGVGTGIRMDGEIPNMFFQDSSVDGTIDTYDGIPVSGSFSNYVDPYGIIHSARWSISGDTLDITFITKDPRIPGVPEEGRIVRIGRSVRVFKTGIVTVTRQLLRIIDGGYVILGQGVAQTIGEFQTTFGCGDETSDPFAYHYNNNVLDQVEMYSNSVLALQDPEDSTDEFEWWPAVLTGTVEGFRLFDGGQFGPVTELPAPSE